MAAFDRDTDRDRLDFHLMMRSPVRWVSSRALLDDTVAWLDDNGYRVVSVDAGWLITAHMFRDIGSAIGGCCHDQWQCLHEAFGAAVAETWDRYAGFVLVLVGFDLFYTRHAAEARMLLDLVMDTAWPNALLGRRVLCLVQSDDPHVHIPPAGKSSVPWVHRVTRPGPQWGHISA